LCKELGVDQEAYRVVNVVLAMDEVYTLGQSTSPACPGVRPPAGYVSLFEGIFAQGRQEYFGVSSLAMTSGAARSFVAGLSSQDPFRLFLEGAASAAQLPLAAAAQWALTGAIPLVSALHIGSTTYAIPMTQSSAVMVHRPTLEALTGHVPGPAWERALPGFRHANGHRRKARIRTSDAQERQDALRAFLTAHPRPAPSRSGTATKFRAAMLHAWNAHCRHLGKDLWVYHTADALWKAASRLR
jgi:hypothetical protein